LEIRYNIYKAKERLSKVQRFILIEVYKDPKSDGKNLFYTREPVSTYLRHDTVEGSGKNQKVKTEQLTTGTYNDLRLSISPDGSLIAFTRKVCHIENIYVMPIERGNPRLLIF